MQNGLLSLQYLGFKRGQGDVCWVVGRKGGRGEGVCVCVCVWGGGGSGCWGGGGQMGC